MINKIIVQENKIGESIRTNITLEELKELLYSGVCIQETQEDASYGRVLFCWGGRLYVRAI